MATGGNPGGGVLQTTWPSDYTRWAQVPFGRMQMLNAMVEELRSHDWPVTAITTLAEEREGVPEAEPEDEV